MKKRPSMNKRALLFFGLFSLLFFVLIYRFSVIQLTGHAAGKELKTYAEQKHSKARTLEASRGSILDRHGEPLAIDTISYKLVAILDESVTPDSAKTPKHVSDPEATAKVLAQYIDMEESEIYERLTKDVFQVEFGQAGNNLTNEIKLQIEELKLPGITFIRESKRSYPNGVFASHLIGFANFVNEGKDDNPQLIGQMGLEKTLNDYLIGQNGSIEYKSDRWGYILPTASTEITEPQNGGQVNLTVDKKIQTFLEEAMNEVQTEYEPSEIMGVVADAKTGAILAMSQRPTFDPNTREGIEENWQNIIVENAFEPGSTAKIFTLAAAIEEGVFNPEETYQSGRFEVKGAQPIRDHNRSGWGEITMLEGFKRSSNVMVSTLVEKMGTDTFRNYLDKFKFGQPTGFGLENEATGVIQYKYPRDQYATSYGQGSSVTALQMIQATTAITNNGKMMKPYIVEKITDDSGKVIQESGQKEVGTPISPETAQKTLQVMESAVSGEHGTGKRYMIDGYRVAGKTGTAQIYEQGKGYLTGNGNHIYSFIGVAPAEDPKLIVYVNVKQPKLEEEQGSVPVSSLFNSVMKNSLQYLNIEPKGTVEKVKVNTLTDYASKNVTKVKTDLEEQGLKPVIVGQGSKVQYTVPSKDSKLVEGEKVIVVTDGKLTMPDMTGWSLSDSMKLVNSVNMQFSFTGSGYIVSQNIEPNTVISEESNLIVELKPPLEALKAKEIAEEENSSTEEQLASTNAPEETDNTAQAEESAVNTETTEENE